MGMKNDHCKLTNFMNMACVDVIFHCLPCICQLCRYAGRKPAAATATGLGARAHNAEQEEIYNTAFAPVNN